MQMDRRYRREWPCCNGPGGTVGGELPGRHGGVASVVQKQFAALGSICVKLNATKAASVHQHRVLVQPEIGAGCFGAGCKTRGTFGAGTFSAKNAGRVRFLLVRGPQSCAAQPVRGAGLFQVPPAWEWERKGFPPFVQRTSN